MAIPGSVHKIFRLVITFLIVCAIAASAKREKPRVIATTDGEIDDHSTMVRFLLYSCDYDVAGIIQNNSVFQPSGHSKEKWFEKQMEAYKVVLPQLRKHNPDYPSAEDLMSVMRVGNEDQRDLNPKNKGGSWNPHPQADPNKFNTKNTAGEQLIVKVLTDSDPRDVHIGCWGGANTVASALLTIQNSKELTPEQIKRALSKAHIYCIWYQDGGGLWIENNVKEATIWEAWGWWHTWDYGSTGTGYHPKEVAEYMSGTWFNKNQKTGHGALASLSPQKHVSEGDTPSWLNMINNGLEAHVDYTMGGWGGRAIYAEPDKKPNYLSDDPGASIMGKGSTASAVKDDGAAKKANWRWTIAAQNDYEARLDWCVNDFDKANHAPIAAFNGTTVDDGPPILKIEAKPGQKIELDATGSKDPDNHTLSYKWWVYKEAGTYGKDVAIENANTQKASITMPSDALDKTIQVLIEVTDNGTPPLKGWRRAMIKVTNNPSTPVLERDLLKSSMEPITIRTTVSNGLTTVNLPQQFKSDSHIMLYNLSGRALPFTMVSSSAAPSITYQSNGIAFLKLVTNQSTSIFKIMQ